MVLVSDGRAEQRHEAVTQELIHRALVAVHLGERPLEEPAEQHVHAVRAQPLRQRGGADEIAEEHGDGLSLALHRAARGEDLLGEVARGIRIGLGARDLLGGSARGLDRAPAARAKACSVRKIGAAAGAGRGETGAAADAESGPGRAFLTTLRAGWAGASGHAGIMALLGGAARVEELYRRAERTGAAPLSAGGSSDSELASVMRQSPPGEGAS
jgi:hypothetical protein